MAILLLGEEPTKEQISQISEEFEDYVKIVVDVRKKIIAAGGKLHADCEKMLLKEGSRQDDLWGGGIDLKSKKIDCTALVNIRPNKNNDSMEILDPNTREKFFKIVKNYFKKYGQ